MQTYTSVAILADIHGNVAALDAVLADLLRHTPDYILLAGDLVMNGPRPAETMVRIHALDLPSVLGNTDVEVLQASDPVSVWTRQQLTPKDVAYLHNLPLLKRISPNTNGARDCDLLVTHATPRDCFDLLILEPHPLGTTFTCATPQADAQIMLNGERANVIVFGHIHYFSHATIHGQALRSISAVGFPFDGDQRAAYTIARWNGRSWEFEDQRIAYDFESVADELEQSGMPFAPRYARMIREANWFPRPT
jgi:protein phosphatase